jgi:hypothetical protein
LPKTAARVKLRTHSLGGTLSTSDALSCMQEVCAPATWAHSVAHSFHLPDELQVNCESKTLDPEMERPLFMLNGEYETKFEIVRWCNIGVGKTIGRLKDNLRLPNQTNIADWVRNSAGATWRWRSSGTALVTVLAGTFMLVWP